MQPSYFHSLGFYSSPLIDPVVFLLSSVLQYLFSKICPLITSLAILLSIRNTHHNIFLPTYIHTQFFCLIVKSKSPSFHFVHAYHPLSPRLTSFEQHSPVQHQIFLFYWIFLCFKTSFLYTFGRILTIVKPRCKSQDIMLFFHAFSCIKVFIIKKLWESFS